MKKFTFVGTADTHAVILRWSEIEALRSFVIQSIEAKGDPSIKVKSPAGSRSSSFNSAVGQIITRMHRNGKRGYKYGYKYGVAFPISFRKMVLRKIPFDVMDKLNLYLFFIDGVGNVEEMDWKKVKNMKLSVK